MQLKMNVVKTRILMVCLGNICRSPLAEGIMRTLILEEGLDQLFEVDSAGTSNQCVGNLPDPRSIKVAKENGIELHHRARQLGRKDFDRFDHILVMDESNLKNVLNLAKFDIEKGKVSLITDFDPRPHHPSIVADPYWGGYADFVNVYEQLNVFCQGWLKFQREKFSEAL